ncbi:cytochrome P450 [Zopfia rhizophila CBS 207.26]|uniref:Cytochrome P450 n=1 Tax=Zopfia rhizophila CBS 207.26 TaxID=1314779 RepID=A0A6A6DW58_9PEZI|nr:cytochrome P450 [Zopfia rhizophila CBS 207.26]
MESLGFVHLVVSASAILVTYLASTALYNIYFHPLSQLPGPKFWAAFRLPYIVSLWRGKLVYQVFDYHQKYGEVVRVAPNEVSFSNTKAWDDIYCRRPGHKPFPKNPIWWGEVPGRAESIVSASTWDNHERLRKMLSHCFTDRALAAEEPLVQRHVSRLIEKLLERSENSGKGNTVVNIVDWYMFTTFDIIGDLSFGDPSAFGCLENSEYHPWVLEIFSYFKLGALFSTIRFYDLLAQLLMRMLPAKTVEAQERNYQWACKKVHRRMNLEIQREDFMNKILPYMDEDPTAKKNHGGLSLAELENNFYVLTVAGSETCGTVLSGTTSYLVKSPEALGKLTKEVRDAFFEPEEMSFNALIGLPYLNAVIEEGLRLSPPVGGALAHVVPEGGDSVCGIWLPGGTNVGVHQWSAYRSPSKFHKPSEFLPERWLESSIRDLESPFYHDQRDGVQSFSTGSWSCIGKNLGMAELRLILARMVWSFDMSLAPGGKTVDWGTQKQYVLVEKEGFDVKLVPRAVAQEHAPE